MCSSNFSRMMMTLKAQLGVWAFVVLLFIPTSGYSAEPVSRHLLRVAKVKAGALNLRKGPGTQHPVLLVLREGSKVFFLPQPRNGWVQVTTQSGVQGWSSLNFLQTINSRQLFPVQSRFELPDHTNGELHSAPDEGTYAFVKVDSLNVRSGPGTEFEVVKIVVEGTHLFIEEKANEPWVRIQIPHGPAGWAARKYLLYYKLDQISKISRISVPERYTSPLEAGIFQFLDYQYGSERLNRKDQLSMVVQDLTTGKLHVSIRPRKRVKSASLIKVPVLHAYMLQRFNQKIRHSQTKQVHLEQMIRFSSNDSTNSILRTLGGPERAHNILAGTGMYRELSLVEYIPKDGRTYRNKISTADLNQIFVRLSFGRALGPEFSTASNRSASKQMLYLLSLPGYKWMRDRIKDGTCFASREVVRIWDKTGFVKGTNGNAGIVEIDTPYGRRSYTIAHIMERGNYRSIPGDANRWSKQVALVLRKLSEMTFAYFSSLYHSYNQCGLGLLIQYATMAKQTERSSAVPL